MDHSVCVYQQYVSLNSFDSMCHFVRCAVKLIDYHINTWFCVEDLILLLKECSTKLLVL